MTEQLFASLLADWHRRCGRHDLPWQRFDTPYERWVSEVMLQQTQAETVVGYFDRFLAAFPNVERLAKASQDEIMKIWAGLGYYSRARNLLKAAKIVLEDYQGRFPDSAFELIKLPGVGPSTAAAVAAFTSHESAVPMIDGNVKRVMARVYAIKGRLGEKEFEAAVESAAREALPGSPNIADYTQGLMDLGSLVCKKHDPDCPKCPVKSFCRACALGEPMKYPQPKLARAKKERWLSLGFVFTREGLWLRSASGNIWKGLSVPVIVESDGRDWDELMQGETFGLKGNWLVKEFARLKHELTHQRIHMRAALLEPKEGDSAPCCVESLSDRGLAPQGRQKENWPGMPAPVQRLAEIALKTVS